LPGEHGMIGGLIRGDRSIRLVVVRRLDERVLRQPSAPTIGDEIAIKAEVLRSQEGHPEGAALSEVVDLALASGHVEPTVDALPVAEPDDAGIELSEGRPEVRELQVRSGWAGHGRESVVEVQIELRECGQVRKMLGQ